jgi:hypothetical protein
LNDSLRVEWRQEAGSLSEIKEGYATDCMLPRADTMPALALVINAVVDALSDLGVRHVEMPATPERVWRAIEAARRHPASSHG